MYMMRKYILICLLLGLHCVARGQTEYAYRYWVDRAVEIEYGGTSSDSIWTLELDVDTLREGFHQLYFQVRDTAGVWSVPYSRFFVKAPTKYDTFTVQCYVRDSLFQEQTMTAEGGLVNWNLDVTPLPYGLYPLRLQVNDSKGIALSVEQSFFWRENTDNECGNVRCLYTVDGGRTMQEAPEIADGSYQFDLDLASLREGMHQLLCLIVNEEGEVLCSRNSFFMVSHPKVSYYKYWVNDDTLNTKSVIAQSMEPYALMEMLDVDLYPIRPSSFYFAMEDDKPYIYAKNNFHVKFYTTYGTCAMDSSAYADVRTRREVTDMLPLDAYVPRTDATPEADSIRWYRLEAYTDSVLNILVNQPCTVQLFSPEGEELLRASGEAVTDTLMCNAAGEGYYYVALHSVTGGDSLTTISYTRSRVKHYTMEYIVDGETYAVEQIEPGDSIIAPTEPVKEGYTFSGWSEIPATMPTNDVKVTGSFVINSYLIMYMANDTVYHTDSVMYNAEVVVPETVPFKKGHTFMEWSEVPDSMPAHDVTVSAIFTVNRYKVSYVLEGEAWMTDSIAYGVAVSTFEAPAKEGYLFNGWTEVPETMPSHDIVLYGSYRINTDLKYDLVYMVDGEEYKRVTLTFCDTITLEPVPTREGHTFSGWSEVPDIMPLYDVTVAGSFSVNTYKVTYTVDGGVYHIDSVAFGTELTAIEAPVKEGYTFSGWSEMPATMPSYDVSVSGTFTVNAYTLTYMVDGEVYYTETITYSATLTTIEAPTKEGYTFSGWSETPEMMPAGDVTITGEFILNATQTDEQGLVYTLNASGDAFEVSDYTTLTVEDLVIPTALYGVPVTSIKDKVLMGAEEVKSIVIPANIEKVGERALYGCSNLLVVEWNTTVSLDAAYFGKAESYGNMLVYVADAATEIGYKGNVVIEGMAERITLTDELPFRNTRNFTALHITFTHTFEKKTKIGVSGGWEAMVLPFDVQSVVSKNRGELKPFGEADFTTSLPYWLGELQADGTFATTQRITANKPFIMQLPNSDEYRDIYNVEGEVTFSATNVTVYPTTDVEQEASNGYVMLGNYEGTTADSHVYALNDEEYTADGEIYMPGSIFVANSRDIRPFEAYVYTTNASRAPYLRVGNAGETGIGHSTFNVQHSTEIYDLTGRKVLNTETLKGGVYIVNGKKVIFK